MFGGFDKPTVYRKKLPFPKTAYGWLPLLSTYSVTPELLQLLNSFPLPSVRCFPIERVSRTQ
jgi:hypothetical protein